MSKACFSKHVGVILFSPNVQSPGPVVELDEVQDDDASSLSEESMVSSRMSMSSAGRAGSQASHVSHVDRPVSVPADAARPAAPEETTDEGMWEQSVDFAVCDL